MMNYRSRVRAVVDVSLTPSRQVVESSSVVLPCAPGKKEGNDRYIVVSMTILTATGTMSQR
jgi:hypothetical protein